MAKNIVKKSKKNPTLSVVMSVYNGEKYLHDSIDSILSQTFKDFEFIIIDDGSTDNTLKIIKGFKDPRIVFISRKNKGLAESLNEGIKKAKGTYVARQDADDISNKDRIKKELTAITKSKADTVFSFFELINEENEVTDIFTSPIRKIDLIRSLYLRNTLGHGTAMFKKSAFIEAGQYDPRVGPVEDYALWAKFIEKKYNFVVVPSSLYHWRDNPLGVSSSNVLAQKDSADNIRRYIIGKAGVPMRSPIAYALDLLKDTKSISDLKIRNKYKEEMFYNQIRLLRVLVISGKPINALATLACIAVTPKEILFVLNSKFIKLLRTVLHKYRTIGS